jgi:hypothetical protein
MPRSSHSGRGVAAKDGCQLPDDARRACVRAAETECSFADAVLRLAYGGPTKAASAPPLFDPQGWREGKWPPQVAEAVWTLCAAIQQGRVPAGAHGFPIDAKQWARQSELEGYRVFAREPGQLIARVEFETRGMLVAVAGLELAFPAAAEPAPEQSEPAPPQEDTPHLPEEDALDPLGPAPAPQKGAKPTEPPKTAAATIATIKIGVTTKQRVEDYLNKNCIDPKTPGLAEAIKDALGMGFSTAKRHLKKIRDEAIDKQTAKAARPVQSQQKPRRIRKARPVDRPKRALRALSEP